MKKVEVSTGYTPREWQNEVHAAMRRFNVLVCHRRSGKTTMCINELIDQGLRNPRRHPKYGYFAPFRDQAKKVAWDGNTGFKEFTRNIPGVSYNEAELRVDIPRPHMNDTLRFQLFGAENPDATRGMYFDMVVLDEYAQMDPTIWGEVLRPALADREGGAIFIGTPKGKNKFYDLLRSAQREMKKKDSEWFAAVKTVDDTGVIPKKEMESLTVGMSPEEVAQEFYCDFLVGNKGTFYAHQIAGLEATGHVRKVRHQAGFPVYTGWDLGRSDGMATWFWQQVGNELHIIDYYEDMEGGGMPAALTALVTNERADYLYHTHFVPHDGGQHDISGKSRVQDLIDLRRGRVDILPRHAVYDGINEVRKILPRCYFDEDTTENGLERLKAYKKKFDRKRELYLGDPQHDENSHGSDAFRTMAMALRQELGSEEDNDQNAIFDYDPFTMEVI